MVSGASEPDQWKDRMLWRRIVDTHRIMVTTPQVLLDALRHGYLSLGNDISLLVFDEVHHAGKNHPYNAIMKEFYFKPATAGPQSVRPMIMGLTASPIFGGDVAAAFR
jgi:endoribonuclease Dicer